MNKGLYQLFAYEFRDSFAIGFDNFADFVQEVITDWLKCPEEISLNSPNILSLKFLVGASIVSEIRQAIKVCIGLECSAGIANNKILARLAASMIKPNQQIILPPSSIPELYKKVPLSEIKGLDSKFGKDVCKAFKIKTMAELSMIPKEELLRKIDEKKASWLYLIARGVNYDKVGEKPKVTKSPEPNFEAGPSKMDCEEEFQICSICKKKIPTADLVSHKDFHLGMQISQKERKEYQQSLSAKKHGVRPLQSYFSQPKNEAENLTKCPKCSLLVPEESLQEHLDLHVARKVQIKLNKEEMVKVTPKRRRSKDDKKEKDSSKQNTLDSFLK